MASTSLSAVRIEAKLVPGHAASAGTGRRQADAVGTPRVIGETVITKQNRLQWILQGAALLCSEHRDS